MPVTSTQVANLAGDSTSACSYSLNFIISTHTPHLGQGMLGMLQGTCREPSPAIVAVLPSGLPTTALNVGSMNSCTDCTVRSVRSYFILKPVSWP